jgi:hypothetical protein
MYLCVESRVDAGNNVLSVLESYLKLTETLNCVEECAYQYEHFMV